MSLALSNNARRALVGCGALVFSLSACAHANVVATSSPRPAADSRVGYVRMEALVKVHPLYSQLARLDDDMAALQLQSVGPQIARSGADIAVEEKALQHELDLAADRTKKALADKQVEYAKREQAAIDAAVGGGSGSGPGGGAIAGGIVAQTRAQQRSVLADAQKNLNAYRAAVISQDQSAVQALNTSLAERASRTYRAKVDELQKNESDDALSLASADATERLSLRAQLSNLALDDASRATVKAQLDALDKKEADALAAMKNRDQSTLVALQTQLHDDVRAQLATQVAKMRARTVAKINEREQSTRKEIVAKLRPLPQSVAGGSVNVPTGIAPDMRAKLEALHRKYQQDFNKDARVTIASFQQTRADLTRRFQQLGSVDASAQAGAQRQMDALQKQRGDLYSQMVAQIGREVKTVAEKRGIDVVISGVVAPVGGVDLTADAEKDIESLHE